MLAMRRCRWADSLSKKTSARAAPAWPVPHVDSPFSPALMPATPADASHTDTYDARHVAGHPTRSIAASIMLATLLSPTRRSACRSTRVRMCRAVSQDRPQRSRSRRLPTAMRGTARRHASRPPSIACTRLMRLLPSRRHSPHIPPHASILLACCCLHDSPVPHADPECSPQNLYVPFLTGSPPTLSTYFGPIALSCFSEFWHSGVPIDTMRHRA